MSTTSITSTTKTTTTSTTSTTTTTTSSTTSTTTTTTSSTTSTTTTTTTSSTSTSTTTTSTTTATTPIMQCILPQSQTIPEKYLSNPWHGKGFCEPNQYKSAIDRYEGGHKSCDLSIEIYKELVKNLVLQKQHGSIQAVEKLAERNEDITKNIQHNVIDKMITYKNSKYEKSFLHMKKVKEF
ncbi:unnamed protein product [Rotaria sordida]|uniref:Uncharacterized protein n=2 Tax=Rotaria sordida TaxID=392033 RepID=A0A814SYJ4_9BILA|nr:unnamed protein product [Rotaria sordida]